MVAMLPEPGRKVGKWVQMKVKVKVGKMERVRLREGWWMDRAMMGRVVEMLGKECLEVLD